MVKNILAKLWKIKCEDLCCLCGNNLFADGVESWFLFDIEIPVSTSSEVWACVSTENDELVAICEPCYKANKFTTMNEVDTADVHHEFAIEYMRIKKFDTAISCCDKALGHKFDLAYLNTKANCLDRVGKRKEAKNTYQRVLDIDSENFIARNNIKNL